MRARAKVGMAQEGRTERNAPAYPRLLGLIAIFLLLGAGQALAMGERENPLDTIDALIEEQRYDEALGALAAYARAYPERFDLAQDRIRKIIKIRGDYQDRANSVVDVVVNDPENQERKLGLIRELEALDRYPNPTVKASIDEIWKTARFTDNRARFTRVMEEGRALIEARRYIEAARRYQGAFELYREEFLGAGYGELTVNAVLSWVDRAGQAIDKSEAAGARLDESLKALERAFASVDAPSFESAFAAAWPAAESSALLAMSVRNDAAAAGRSIRAQFDLLKAASGTLTEDSWLPFAWRLTLGRPDLSQLEGIVGALDSRLALPLRQAQSAIVGAVERRSAEANALYDAGEAQRAAAAYRFAGLLAERGLRVIGLWYAAAADDLAAESGVFGNAAVSIAAPDWFLLQHRRDVAYASSLVALARARALAAAGEAKAWGDSDQARGELQVVLAAYSGYRARIDAELRLFDEESALSADRGKRLREREALGLDPGGATAFQDGFDARIVAAREEARASIAGLALRAALRERETLGERLASAEGAAASARPLLEGNAEEAGDSGFVSRFPSRAEALLSANEAFLKALRDDNARYLARWGGEEPFIASSSPIILELDAVRALDQRAAEAALANAALLASARELRGRALAARSEAERRVAEARSALTREDFDTARERLDRARERYLASLAVEDDKALEASSQAILNDLGADIIQAQNQRVVRDTRALLTRGKDAYYLGDFDRAEQALLSARSTWSRTNTDRNPEVEDWLTIVQTALSIKTGRDIPVTAPLFPEMSQILSLARRYFEDGRALWDKGDKVGAQHAFALSRQKLQEVKVVFPLNQEARVLELRIVQLVDAPAFRASFARLLAETKTKAASRAELQEAYTDLLDLQAIDPRYPGLAAEVNRVEILLGIRLPPPDPAALAQSRRLTALAQGIYDSGRVSQFANAVAQLDQALKLDPTNDAAARLKDRLVIYTPGITTLGLPKDGESLLSQATVLYTSGDYISTRARLNLLVARYAEAARVPRFIDLDSRLQAKGY